MPVEALIEFIYISEDLGANKQVGHFRKRKLLQPEVLDSAWIT